MKQNLRKKIVIGICTAAFMSQQVTALAGHRPKNAANDQLPMTTAEQNFAKRLSASAKELFLKMDHDGRQLAIKIASHGCQGRNDCKGEGGCRSDKNSCRGQNECKGQGSCKVPPSDAVSMAAKREGIG